jgi:hypothetical protein
MVEPEELTQPRRGVPALALLVVLALCAVGALVVWQRSDPPQASPLPVNPPASGFRLRAALDGWRWESRDGLQALVPAAWTWGVTATSWCNRIPLGHATGVVVVDGNITQMRCPHAERVSQYVPFLSLGIPEGVATGVAREWRTKVWRVDGKLVTVRADDPAVFYPIVASVSVVKGTDRNGCPLRTPALADHAWRPSPSSGVSVEPDRMVVCRYGSLVGGRLLSFSTVVPQPEAAAAMRSLLGAPPGSGPNNPRDCAPSVRWGNAVTILRVRHGGSWADYLVRFDGCDHHYTDDGTRRRRLTEAVVRTALIGWRGPTPRGSVYLWPR